MNVMEDRDNNWQKDLQFLLGDTAILEQLAEQKSYIPFSEETIDFLDALYQALRKENRSVQVADLAAFSFWCRKGNLSHIREQYARQWNGKKVIGRGVAFHIVPSNIPVLFAFSMAASLLAGDPVVLRLPEKETVQEQMILSALRQVMETQPEWKKRIVILRYGHVKEVTDALSRLCQVRVIWGGDHSIQEIQKSVLEPGKTELAFADRRSAAVLRADAILEKEDLTDIVRGFYNDTYLNDQNACSSPSLLYWLGSSEQTALAHEKFWKVAAPYIQSRYELGAHLAVQKWEQAMYLAATKENVKIQKFGNEVVLVKLPGAFRECMGADSSGRILFRVQRRKSGWIISGFDKKMSDVNLCKRNRVYRSCRKADLCGCFRCRSGGTDRTCIGFFPDLGWDGSDRTNEQTDSISVEKLERKWRHYRWNIR